MDGAAEMPNKIPITLSFLGVVSKDTTPPFATNPSKGRIIDLNRSLMKRFVIIYMGQAFPVRSKSMETVKLSILRAYGAQDDSEMVDVGWLTMSSADIANGNYTILDLDEWFKMRKGPLGPSRS